MIRYKIKYKDGSAWHSWFDISVIEKYLTTDTTRSKIDVVDIDVIIDHEPKNCLYKCRYYDSILSNKDNEKLGLRALEMAWRIEYMYNYKPKVNANTNDKLCD
jgi:hypothetical protein